MSAETLSQALGGIDLKYISEAADYRRPRAKKRRMAPRLLAAAACLALALAACTAAPADKDIAAPEFPWANGYDQTVAALEEQGAGWTAG